jgi:hypothetical protein
MKTPAKIALCAVVLFLALVLFWQNHAPVRQPGQTGNTASQTVPPPAVPVSSPPNGQPSGAAAAVPVAMAQPGEPVATRRMYAAHAPLRMPEVADPDSGTNRQVLQAMVQKALQRKAADAPANNPDSAR